MISSFSWRSGFRLVAVVLAVMALLTACSPTRNGYFLPEVNAVSRLTTGTDAPIVPADTVPTLAKETDSNLSKKPATSISGPAGEPIPVSASKTSPTKSIPDQHRNPESRSVRRIKRLFNPIPVAHVAPKQLTAFDQHNPARKTYRLALVALGLGVLGYAPLLLIGGTTLVWVLSLIIPLTAIMMGAASLATISRNKDRFRGKGWAMAAIVLGTGVLGLAMIALAALSMSKVVREK